MGSGLCKTVKEEGCLKTEAVAPVRETIFACRPEGEEEQTRRGWKRAINRSLQLRKTKTKGEIPFVTWSRQKSGLFLGLM